MLRTDIDQVRNLALKDPVSNCFIISRLNDLNNNFIGSLTISYYGKEHKLSLDEWILIRQKVGAIGTILTDYLHRH